MIKLLYVSVLFTTCFSSITEFTQLNSNIWTDLATCVGMNTNSWSAELYGTMCTNIDAANGVALEYSSSQFTYDSILHRDNRVSFLDWNGTAWSDLESETFWNLIDNSIVSNNDPITIQLDVVEGAEYILSVIIQPQASEIKTPGL